MATETTDRNSILYSNSGTKIVSDSDARAYQERITKKALRDIKSLSPIETDVLLGIIGPELAVALERDGINPHQESIFGSK